MKNIILLSIIIIILVALCIFFFLKMKKYRLKFSELNKEKLKSLKNKEIEYLNKTTGAEISWQKTISKLKLENKDNINSLKEKQRKELQVEFKNGYEKGIEVSKIEIRVTPIKKEKKEGNFLSKKEILEIGFSYRLFSNGIPCLDPHEEIIEIISKKEMNEQNIKLIISKIENAFSKFPNTNLIITESLNGFKKKLLKNKK